MVKLDVTCMRHLSKEEFRVLTAIEMGMKNHEIVPVVLITSIARLRHSGLHKLLGNLLRFKLISHDRTSYDGYKLTYQGYDILALNTLLARNVIAAVGNKIGVGKESDVYVAQSPAGEELVLKLHRLGRTSFRSVKKNRDYLRGRQKSNWLYMSRLSALKEYAFMQALHRSGFRTPVPLDANRHCVAMSVVAGYPMYQIRQGEMADPEAVLAECVEILQKLARHGLIHGDYNEFNLMVDKDTGAITLIDFPQMVSTSHPNADELFDRDVGGLVRFFHKKMKLAVGRADLPTLAQAMEGGAGEERLDLAARASGFTEEEEQKLETYYMETAHNGSDDGGEAGADSDEQEHSGEGEEEENEESDEENEKPQDHMQQGAEDSFESNIPVMLDVGSESCFADDSEGYSSATLSVGVGAGGGIGTAAAAACSDAGYGPDSDNRGRAGGGGGGRRGGAGGGKGGGARAAAAAAARLAAPLAELSLQEGTESHHGVPGEDSAEVGSVDGGVAEEGGLRFGSGMYATRAERNSSFGALSTDEGDLVSQQNFYGMGKPQQQSSRRPNRKSGSNKKDGGRTKASRNSNKQRGKGGKVIHKPRLT